jgi:hypothetical protein
VDENTTIDSARGRRPRRRRRLLFGVVVAIAVLIPATVYASDRFSDVRSGSVFHDAASALADAGISVGCERGRFCPGVSVSRGQMAGFLHRGLGRASFADNVADLDSESEYTAVPATATVEAGGESGGTGYVVLNGTVSVFTDEDVTDCPCEIEAFVYRAGDDAQGPSAWAQLPAEPDSETDQTNANVAVSWVVPIATGTEETYHLAVFLNGSRPAHARAEASLTAIYVPFGEDVPDPAS